MRSVDQMLSDIVETEPPGPIVPWVKSGNRRDLSLSINDTSVTNTQIHFLNSLLRSKTTVKSLNHGIGEKFGAEQKQSAASHLHKFMGTFTRASSFR